MGERLQKILSQWGVASRRKAEQMITDGRVCLNGAIAQLGQVADPERDRIEIDGQALTTMHRPRPVYLLLHKPAGVVSTCFDPQGRSTVLDLVPTQWQRYSGIHPVGRLDTDSTGALLLTNDGEVTFRLTHPRHAIAKTYRVWVEGHPSQTVLQKWRTGIYLNGKKTLPAEVVVIRTKPHQTLLQVILHEGRNRQIRRVAAKLGHPVLQLQRTAIGPIQLSDLSVGQCRSLRDDEVQYLTNQVLAS
ncbi:MAG: pseudouridine synthase [Synechococcales bacterium]|nr:pseudouridine synthase [Synechococcales bacterium]